jgi:hypothetical protein
MGDEEYAEERTAAVETGKRIGGGSTEVASRGDR